MYRSGWCRKTSCFEYTWLCKWTVLFHSDSNYFRLGCMLHERFKVKMNIMTWLSNIWTNIRILYEMCGVKVRRVERKKTVCFFVVVFFQFCTSFQMHSWWQNTSSYNVLTSTHSMQLIRLGKHFQTHAVKRKAAETQFRCQLHSILSCWQFLYADNKSRVPTGCVLCVSEGGKFNHK